MFQVILSDVVGVPAVEPVAVPPTVTSAATNEAGAMAKEYYGEMDCCPFVGSVSNSLINRVTPLTVLSVNVDAGHCQPGPEQVRITVPSLERPVTECSRHYCQAVVGVPMVNHLLFPELVISPSCESGLMDRKILRSKIYTPVVNGLAQTA